MIVQELVYVVLAIVLVSISNVVQSNETTSSEANNQPEPHQTEQQPDFDIVTYARHKLAQITDPKSMHAKLASEDDNNADSFAPATNRPPIHSFSMIETKVQDEVEEVNPETEQEHNEKEFLRLEKLSTAIDRKKGKKRKKVKKIVDSSQIEQTSDHLRPKHHSEDDFNGAINDANSPVAARTQQLLRNIVTAKVLNKLDLKDHQHEPFDSANHQTDPVQPYQHNAQTLDAFDVGGHKANGAHLTAHHLAHNDIRESQNVPRGNDVNGQLSPEWKDSTQMYIPDDLPSPIWSREVIRSTNIRYEPLSEAVSPHKWRPNEPKLPDPPNFSIDFRKVSYPHNSVIIPPPELPSPYHRNYHNPGQPVIASKSRGTYVEIKPTNAYEGTPPTAQSPFASSPLVPSTGYHADADEGPLQYRVINHYTSVQYPTQTSEPSQPSQTFPHSAHSPLLVPSPSPEKSPTHSHPAMSLTSDRHVPSNHRVAVNRAYAEMNRPTGDGQYGGLHRTNPSASPSPPTAEIARLVHHMNPVVAGKQTSSEKARSKATATFAQARSRHGPYSRMTAKMNSLRKFQPTSSLFGAPNLWPSTPPFLISTPFVDNTGQTHFPIFQADPNHPALRDSDPTTYDFDVDNTDVSDFISSPSSPMGQLYPQLYSPQFSYNLAAFQSPWWLTN